MLHSVLASRETFAIRQKLTSCALAAGSSERICLFRLLLRKLWEVVFGVEAGHAPREDPPPEQFFLRAEAIHRELPVTLPSDRNLKRQLVQNH